MIRQILLVFSITMAGFSGFADDYACVLAVGPTTASASRYGHDRQPVVTEIYPYTCVGELKGADSVVVLYRGQQDLVSEKKLYNSSVEFVDYRSTGEELVVTCSCRLE